MNSLLYRIKCKERNFGNRPKLEKPKREKQTLNIRHNTQNTSISFVGNLGNHIILNSLMEHIIFRI